MGDALSMLGGLIAPAAEAAAPAAEAGLEAAGPALETGFASIGSGLGGAAGGFGGAAGGLGDIVGSGAGMFGGATGLEGTALAGGAGADLGGLLGAGGATAAGTAADFMGAPGASAFSPGALSTDPAAFGSAPGGAGAPSAPSSTAGSSGLPTFDQNGNMMGNLTSAQGQAPAAPGSSVFNTGTAPVTASPGVGATGGAQTFAAPSGVTPPDPSAIDPTSSAAAGGASATPGGGTGASPVGGTLSQMGNKAITSIENNPLQAAGVALAGGGLVNSLVNKNNVPGQSQVNAINSTLPQLQNMVAGVNQQVQKLQNSTGPLDANTLQMLSYVNNGQLPPAMQVQVDNGVQAAKAQAASSMAAKGLPADPTNNPQLASQYATIDSQALEMKGQIETQLYQAGLSAWQTSNQTQQTAAQLQGNAISATGLDLQTYQALQGIYQNQSNQEQAAIGNLAQALGNMGGGSKNTLTIKTS